MEEGGRRQEVGGSREEVAGRREKGGIQGILQAITLTLGPGPWEN